MKNIFPLTGAVRDRVFYISGYQRRCFGKKGRIEESQIDSDEKQLDVSDIIDGPQVLSPSVVHSHLIGIAFILLAINCSLIEAQVLPSKHWDLTEEFKMYIHESWTSEQGLPSDVVTAIAKAPDGYLWIGTQSGLARFNGLTFRIQNRYNTEGMENDFIRRLTLANDSTIWIGTDHGGVLSLRHDRIIALNPTDSGSAEGTRSLIVDKNGSVWVAIPGAGVWKRVNERWQQVATGRPLTSTWIVLEDSDGSHWLGEDGALAHLNDTTATWFGRKEGMPKAQILSLLRDSRGTLLIGTRQHGLYHFRSRWCSHSAMTEVKEYGLVRTLDYSIMMERELNHAS